MAFLRIAFAFVLCAASALAMTEAGYHPEQLAALDTLYKTAGGPSWSYNTEWLNPLYCLRYGVKCDVQRNVVSLYALDEPFFTPFRAAA